MQATSLASTVGQPAGLAAVPLLSMPQSFPVVLDSTHLRELEQRVAGFDVRQVVPSQVATLGSQAEEALNRTLDGFLAHIDKHDAPELFKLVTKLNEAVEQEKLGEVADSILNAQPGLFDRIIGLFSRKAFRNAVNKAYDEACRVASNKSKKLSDVVAGMELQLRTEMTALSDELRRLESLKLEYRKSFEAFAKETVFVNSALTKAREYLAGALASEDLHVRGEAQDLLQALESRALALEYTLTKLPADQLVIRQLQNAGIATLQELATTMASRFASIKGTLLTIHGARMVQDVQRLGEQGAALDQNLAAVRSKLMHDVVGKAANAPGDNRLAQAKQIQGIVSDTRGLLTLVDTARQSNLDKFDQTRAILAKARTDMTDLGKAIQPGRPLST